MSRRGETRAGLLRGDVGHQTIKICDIMSSKDAPSSAVFNVQIAVFCAI